MTFTTRTSGSSRNRYWCRQQAVPTPSCTVPNTTTATTVVTTLGVINRAEIAEHNRPLVDLILLTNLNLIITITNTAIIPRINRHRLGTQFTTQLQTNTKILTTSRHKHRFDLVNDLSHWKRHFMSTHSNHSRRNLYANPSVRNPLGKNRRNDLLLLLLLVCSLLLSSFSFHAHSSRDSLSRSPSSLPPFTTFAKINIFFSPFSCSQCHSTAAATSEPG